MAETKTAAEALLDALRAASDAMREPIKAATDGMAEAEQQMGKALRTIAADQVRIQEKIRNGSRLSTHRFTPRLPLR